MNRNLYLYFIIALLLHLLFLFPVIFILDKSKESIYQPFYAKFPKKDFSVLPAYIAPNIEKPTPQTEEKTITKEKKEISKLGLEKPKETQTITHKQKSTPLEYTAGSNDTPSSAEKTFDDELLKILHEATGRALVYPRLSAGFYLTGTVRIRFLISPDGRISEAKVIKSSGFGAFDEAAFRAINTISPVQGVHAYLTSPKYVTAVIMFK